MLEVFLTEEWATTRSTWSNYSNGSVSRFTAENTIKVDTHQAVKTLLEKHLKYHQTATLLLRLIVKKPMWILHTFSPSISFSVYFMEGKKPQVNRGYLPPDIDLTPNICLKPEKYRLIFKVLKNTSTFELPTWKIESTKCTEK